jgi:hypothetical protein
MRRNSYLNEDVLQEIAGRLRFGASDLEERFQDFQKPEPKQWSYPTHPLDDVAAEYGMRGFEFKVLQEAAMRKMKDHTILQHYYKRFLMAAKLVLDDELEKARQYEQRQSEDRNHRDRTYQQRLTEWQNRRKRLTKSWTSVRETIRTRWRKIGKSLATLLEENANMGSMDPRDQIFIDLLSGRGIIVTDRNPNINQRRVKSVNWDAFEDLSIEDINDIIYDLNQSSAGGFIKKPEKG